MKAIIAFFDRFLSAAGKVILKWVIAHPVAAVVVLAGASILAAILTASPKPGWRILGYAIAGATAVLTVATAIQGMIALGTELGKAIWKVITAPMKHPLGRWTLLTPQLLWWAFL